MSMLSFTSGLPAAQPPSLRLRVGHRSGLFTATVSKTLLNIKPKTSQIHTLNHNILVSQQIISPAHLVESLLVHPSVARLVLGSGPAVAAAGVCLRASASAACVRHGLDCLVLVCAVGEGAVWAFTVGIGQMSARSGEGHGRLCLRLRFGGTEEGGGWWGGSHMAVLVDGSW